MHCNDYLGIVLFNRKTVDGTAVYRCTHAALRNQRNLSANRTILIDIIGLIAAFNMVLTAMIIVGTRVIIIEILKMSDELLGITQGVLALGGLYGGVLTAIFRRKIKLSLSPYLLALCAASVGVMAIPLLLQMSSFASFVTSTIASLLVMGFATIFSIQMFATVQTKTPPELVGKVLALMMSFVMCAQPIGQAIYGIAFDVSTINAGFILLIGAVLPLLIAHVSKFQRINRTCCGYQAAIWKLPMKWLT